MSFPYQNCFAVSGDLDLALGHRVRGTLLCFKYILVWMLPMATHPHTLSLYDMPMLNSYNNTQLHFDQKSDGRIVGFSTLPCRMYDTMIFLSVSWLSSVIRHFLQPSVKRHLS